MNKHAFLEKTFISNQKKTKQGLSFYNPKSQNTCEPELNTSRIKKKLVLGMWVILRSLVGII